MAKAMQILEAGGCVKERDVGGSSHKTEPGVSFSKGVGSGEGTREYDHGGEPDY